VFKQKVKTRMRSRPIDWCSPVVKYDFINPAHYTSHFGPSLLPDRSSSSALGSIRTVGHVTVGHVTHEEIVSNDC